MYGIRKHKNLQLLNCKKVSFVNLPFGAQNGGSMGYLYLKHAAQKHQRIYTQHVILCFPVCIKINHYM